MPSLRALPTVAILLVAAGCGMRTGGDLPAGSRSDLIAFEELQERGQYSNLYDLIDVLRPRWLRSQGGPDSFTTREGQVQVHVDGNWLGGVAALRGISVGGVTSIQWIAPLDASARYGLDHSHGAIIVSTRPVH
jgi:hypothetical protein